MSKREKTILLIIGGLTTSLVFETLGNRRGIFHCPRLAHYSLSAGDKLGSFDNHNFGGGTFRLFTFPWHNQAFNNFADEIRIQRN
jgi:hypothetical protein